MHPFECLTFRELYENHDSASSLLLESTMTTLMTLPKDSFPNPQAVGVPDDTAVSSVLSKSKLCCIWVEGRTLHPFDSMLLFLPQRNSSFTSFLQYFCLFQGARSGPRASYTLLFYPNWRVVAQVKFFWTFSTQK